MLPGFGCQMWYFEQFTFAFHGKEFHCSIGKKKEEYSQKRSMKITSFIFKFILVLKYNISYLSYKIISCWNDLYIEIFYFIKSEVQLILVLFISADWKGFYLQIKTTCMLIEDKVKYLPIQSSMGRFYEAKMTS